MSWLDTFRKPLRKGMLPKTPTLDDYLQYMDPKIQKWHQDHSSLFDKTLGSSGNHQAWQGGYKHHLTHCFLLADSLYETCTHLWGPLPFEFPQALKVLYFHDVEKIFKYSGAFALAKPFDKNQYLYNTLLEQYGILFSTEEQNALKYIHGEGDEYRKDARVMNELAGFCHAVDVLSARVLHDRKDPIR